MEIKSGKRCGRPGGAHTRLGERTNEIGNREKRSREGDKRRNRRSHLFMVAKVNGSINCVHQSRLGSGVRSSSLLMGLHLKSRVVYGFFLLFFFILSSLSCAQTDTQTHLDWLIFSTLSLPLPAPHNEWTWKRSDGLVCSSSTSSNGSSSASNLMIYTEPNASAT